MARPKNAGRIERTPEARAAMRARIIAREAAGLDAAAQDFAKAWPGESVRVRCAVSNVHFGDGRFLLLGEEDDVPSSLADALITKGMASHV